MKLSEKINKFRKPNSPFVDYALLKTWELECQKLEIENIKLRERIVLEISKQLGISIEIKN